MKRAGRSQDEGRAVASQQSARRPHDGAVLEEGDPEFDQGAGRKTDENLGHREPEAEHRLAQHLERYQHGCDMHPWITQAGKDDRVFPAEEAHRPALGAHR